MNATPSGSSGQNSHRSLLGQKTAINPVVIDAPHMSQHGSTRLASLSMFSPGCRGSHLAPPESHCPGRQLANALVQFSDYLCVRGVSRLQFVLDLAYQVDLAG
jgi:hypothetical protein